ncbi:MAG: hypothetical protein IJJ69_02170 [Oscillospiraceae bacterium]|nr:hypothetical protein [Oscillospiraceae bacterium]
MNLNDFLLVKVFKKSKYMEDFNNGNIYLNSTSYFWNLENTFQQDKEGAIFQQKGRGFLFKGNDAFLNILWKSSTVDDVIKYTKEENVGQLICETTEFSFRLNGYLCCFYLLPKKDVSFTGNIFSIITEDAKKDITIFLEKYLNESENHDFYATIYDAEQFCNIFTNGMRNKGYQTIYGKVNYKDIDEAAKILLYQKGDLQSILFTKPIIYNYQKEFRILLNKPSEETKGHISENIIGIEKSIYGSFCYDCIKNKKV